MSIVFIRLDKIGDLVATLPIDQHPQLRSPVHWVLSSGLGWIAKQAIPPREYIELSVDKNQWKQSYKSLLDFLKKKKPDAVVVFQAPWWVSLACWRAGIPVRVGRRSQWHSFLFFNRSLRQSRSRSEKHEAEYNQDLVEFGLRIGPAILPPLELHADSRPHLLEKFDLRSKNYIVVHPGMFGSALNWPQSHYNQLIEQLIKKTIVVITGTPQDERFLTEIKARWQNDPHVRILQNKLKMDELLSILSMSSGIVAPSTGVLHLAASLGIPCVGIYSPILAHHPQRWGPRGVDVVYLLPPEGSEQMSDITVEDVLCKLALFN
jgi:ADP-heptose:LPS heptosyltransferase